MIGNTIRTLVWLLLGVAAAAPVLADATANFSPPTARVGQEVQLNIVIENPPSGDPTPELTEEDLQKAGLTLLRGSGRTFRASIENGKVTRVLTISIPVRPEREGTITVPPITVRAGRKDLETNPAMLIVTAAAVPAPKSGGALGSQNNSQDPDKVASRNETEYGYIDLLVPKRTAYEGEMIPAELRIYLNARRIDPNQMDVKGPPLITGQGFTVQKFAQSRQRTQRIGENVYYVLSLKTAICATKVGKMTLGPAKFNFRVPVPTGSFGLGFLDHYEWVSVNMKSDPVDLEVKALPTEGRPPEFDGAVGNFAMSTTVDPKKADVGQAITLTSRITGIGNFDRVNAPTVEESSEWKAYSPSAKFVANDEVGISGTKTFETSIIPRSSQPTTPGLKFSFFDPVAEKYVSLETAPQPVQIVGSALVSKPESKAQVMEASPEASPTPTPKATDLLYIRNDYDKDRGSFLPVWQRQTFQAVQWGAGGAFFLTILALAVSARARNAERQALLAFQKELAATFDAARKPGVTLFDFYANATRYLTISAARAGAVGNPDSAEEVISAKTVSEASADEIREIFKNRDALHYGAGGGSEPIDATLQKRVLAELQAYAKK